MPDNFVLETIRSRFSCRKFLPKVIEEDVLRTIVDAGKYAPSGGNKQSWHFTVLQSQAGKDLLLKAAGSVPPPEFPPHLTWPFQGDFCGAPVVILISGAPDVPWPDIGPKLAAQNIMLAAQSFGLATLWSSLFTKDLFRDEESAAVKSRLMPQENQVYAALFLGYPEVTPQKRPPRRENVETWL